ncbi:unnamed protein product, partial [Discosporangium mesarthrocarpum]
MGKSRSVGEGEDVVGGYKDKGQAQANPDPDPDPDQNTVVGLLEQKSTLRLQMQERFRSLERPSVISKYGDGLLHQNGQTRDKAILLPPPPPHQNPHNHQHDIPHPKQQQKSLKVQRLNHGTIKT